MSENAYFPRLFSPLRVGQRTLRNRIALPATTTNYGARNRVTDRWIDFLAERAKGGAGLVITEIIAVDPSALCQASTVTGYEAENEDGFKRTAEAIEGSELKVYEGSAHGLFFTDKERLNRDLVRFIRV